MRPKLKLVRDDPPGPSRSFISLTRNPDLALRPPTRFEPLPKPPGTLVLSGGKFVEIEDA